MRISEERPLKKVRLGRRYRGLHFWRHPDHIPWIHPCNITWIRPCNIPWIHPCNIPWIHPCKILWIQPCNIPWIHPCNIPWIHPCNIPWIHPCNIPWIHSCKIRWIHPCNIPVRLVPTGNPSETAAFARLYCRNRRHRCQGCHRHRCLRCRLHRCQTGVYIMATQKKFCPRKSLKFFPFFADFFGGYKGILY